jgi:hypothetical protein
VAVGTMPAEGLDRQRHGVAVTVVIFNMLLIWRSSR